MEFFELPKGRNTYTGEDVILLVAEHCGISAEEAADRIANGDMLDFSAFVKHPIIIGKSFGEMIALKSVGPNRRVAHGRYFSPGMIVAVRELGDYDNKPQPNRRSFKKLV